MAPLILHKVAENIVTQTTFNNKIIAGLFV